MAPIGFFLNARYHRIHFNTERLPEEAILHILSYLPLSDVFHSVSFVSKDFRRLAYDRQIVANALHLLDEIHVSIVVLKEINHFDSHQFSANIFFLQ